MSGVETASATGTLSITPLPDVLISLVDRSLTGTLVLEEPDGQKTALFVAQGVVSKARTARVVARLGELLTEMGLVSPEAIDRAVEAPRGPLGRCLVELGYLSERALNAGLREQLCRRTEWACGLAPDSRYGFYAGADLLPSSIPPREALDPLALIWRCARAHCDDNRVAIALCRIEKRPLELHRDARLDRFGLTKREAARFQALVAGRGSFGALLGQVGPADAWLRPLVYVLALTHHLDLGDGRRPAAGAGELRRGPGGAMSPEPQGSSSPVPPSFPSSVVRSAGGDPRSAAPSGPAPTARPARPSEIRTSEQKGGQGVAASAPPGSGSGRYLSTRHQSTDGLKAQGGSQRRSSQSLRAQASAADEFKRAEQLAHRADFEAALPHASAAHRTDPDNHAYGALYAYVMAQCGMVDETNAKHLLFLCVRALKERPESIPLRLYRARLLQRLDRVEDAMRDYRIVSRRDPNNIDALRELRLHQKRQERTGGLFGFLRRTASQPPRSKG